MLPLQADNHSGLPASGGADTRPAPTAGGSEPPSLSPALRERVLTELARAQLGDALERKLFLAALDYQLGEVARRLAARPPDSAQLAELCRAAAGALGDGGLAADLERVCVGFIGGLARAFDDCFETAPTADPGGPFLAVLRQLREQIGLPLSIDPDRLRPLLGTAAASRP